MTRDQHGSLCGCGSCRHYDATYEATDRANREAEARADKERRRQEKAAVAQAKVDAAAQVRADAAAATAAREQQWRDEQRWAEEDAANAEQLREIERMREDAEDQHRERMEMDEKLRVAILLQSEEGRAVLEQERIEAEAEEARRIAARAEADRKDAEYRDAFAAYETERKSYEARRSGHQRYVEDYNRKPHPEANISWFPTGKSILWVIVAVLCVVAQNFLFVGWVPAILGLILAAILAAASMASTSRATIIPRSMVITSLAFLVAGYKGSDPGWGGPVSVGIGLAGIILVWAVHQRLSLTAERGNLSRALRKRDLDAAHDPDLLIAQTLGVDVDKVRPLPEPVAPSRW